MIIWAAISLQAQEGEYYRGIRQVMEKEYQIRTSFGQNKMHLNQLKTGYYNDEGELQSWILQQANKTYLGQIQILSSKDAKTKETLYYDYMNRVSGRKYELQDANETESTVIEYDAKGKLANKTRYRYFAAGDEIWSFEYNQVGYISSYSQTKADENAIVLQEYEYNYYDELTAIHSYIYAGDEKQLCEIRSESPEGKLQKRVEYTYDEAGLLLEEKRYAAEDIPAGGIRYTYDENKRLIQKLEYQYNPRYGGVFQATRQSDYSYF